MTKILICGDSFAADWSRYGSLIGWPNLLAEQYDVTNLAQAGCGEYKIYLQLKSVHLSDFDAIIVSHTSPNRLYVKNHPVHKGMHVDSDLIYADIKAHSKKDASLAPIVDYFEKYFDLHYAEFVHSLICKEIDELLDKHNVIHMTGFDWSELYQFPDIISFESIASSGKNYANHFNAEGNKMVFESIMARLK